MLFKVTYDYTQSSSKGGMRSYYKKEIVLYNCSEDELVQYVNEFLKDNKCGYRTNISLVDVIRV